MPVQTSNAQWASTSSDCIMRSKWGLLATLTFDFNSPLFSLSRQKGPDAYVGKSTSPKIPDFSYCPMTVILQNVMFYEISHLSSLSLPEVPCVLQFFIQPLQSTAWHHDGAATSISFVLRSPPGRWMLTNSMCDCFVTRVSGLLGCSCVSDPLPGSSLCFLIVALLRSCCELVRIFSKEQMKGRTSFLSFRPQRFPCFHVILHAAHPRLSNPQCLATRSLNLMPPPRLRNKLGYWKSERERKSECYAMLCSWESFV